MWENDCFCGFVKILEKLLAGTGSSSILGIVLGGTAGRCSYRCNGLHLFYPVPENKMDGLLPVH